MTAGRSRALGRVNSPVVSSTVARLLAVSSSPKLTALASSVTLMTVASPQRLVSGPVERPLGDGGHEPDDGQDPADLFGAVAELFQGIVAKDALKVGQPKADQEGHEQQHAQGPDSACHSSRSWAAGLILVAAVCRACSGQRLGQKEQDQQQGQQADAGGEEEGRGQRLAAQPARPAPGRAPCPGPWPPPARPSRRPAPPPRCCR